MEVASPLPFAPAQAGSKRPFACSPVHSPLVEMEASDEFAHQSLKRRRFNNNENVDNSAQKNGWNPFASCSASASASFGTPSHGRSPVYPTSGEFIFCFVNYWSRHIYTSLKHDHVTARCDVCIRCGVTYEKSFTKFHTRSGTRYTVRQASVTNELIFFAESGMQNAVYRDGVFLWRAWIFVFCVSLCSFCEIVQQSFNIVSKLVLLSSRFRKTSP